MVGGAQGGVNVEPACVGFFAVLVVHQLAHGFGDILGMHPSGVVASLDGELFGLGGLGLRGGDEAVLLHALNDVELAGARARRIGDGVEG